MDTRQRYEDAKHLIRAGLLFALGILLFLAVRSLLVPEAFGALGHWRLGALADNRAHAVHFAGAAACAECHTDVADLRAGGAHARVGCEACHGAAAAHAADPSSGLPQRPDSRALCPVCHERSVSKPAAFPQIDAAEHAGVDACTSCHASHDPGID